jgi:hypothetical protein
MAFRKSPAWEKERELFLKAAAEAFEAMDSERPVGVFETLEQRETRAVALGMKVARTMLQGDLDGEGETVEAPSCAACPDTTAGSRDRRRSGSATARRRCSRE